jgi:hypothetical protein
MSWSSRLWLLHRDWLDWAEFVGGPGGDAGGLRTRAQPGECAFAVTGLPGLNSEPAIQQWLGDHDTGCAGFLDHSRHAILDRYFERRYTTW